MNKRPHMPLYAIFTFIGAAVLLLVGAFAIITVWNIDVSPSAGGLALKNRGPALTRVSIVLSYSDGSQITLERDSLPSGSTIVPIDQIMPPQTPSGRRLVGASVTGTRFGMETTSYAALSLGAPTASVENAPGDAVDLH